jgi:hypothetical protein
MPDEPKKDSRDRTKPDAPEGAVPTNEQRRFRGSHPSGSKTAGDEKRREIAEGETSGDAPMDPSDEAFIDKS